MHFIDCWEESTATPDEVVKTEVPACAKCQTLVVQLIASHLLTEIFGFIMSGVGRVMAKLLLWVMHMRNKMTMVNKGNLEECYLPGCNTVDSGRSSPMFWSNIGEYPLECMALYPMRQSLL
jgi:hypothetical protein